MYVTWHVIYMARARFFATSKAIVLGLMKSTFSCWSDYIARIATTHQATSRVALEPTAKSFKSMLDSGFYKAVIDVADDQIS